VPRLGPGRSGFLACASAASASRAARKRSVLARVASLLTSWSFKGLRGLALATELHLSRHSTGRFTVAFWLHCINCCLMQRAFWVCPNSNGDCNLNAQADEASFTRQLSRHLPLSNASALRR
jgi:hypothetical protein